jgi:hypothetical protein
VPATPHEVARRRQQEAAAAAAAQRRAEVHAQLRCSCSQLVALLQRGPTDFDRPLALSVRPPRHAQPCSVVQHSGARRCTRSCGAHALSWWRSCSAARRTSTARSRCRCALRATHNHAPSCSTVVRPPRHAPPCSVVQHSGAPSAPRTTMLRRAVANRDRTIRARHGATENGPSTR